MKKFRLALFTIPIVLLGIIFIMTEVGGSFVRKWNMSIIEPAIPLCIGLFLSIGMLMLFKIGIFVKWLKKIMTWFLPLSFLLIFSTDVGASYAWIARADMAIIIAGSMVALTLLFVLIQKLYFKSTP